MIAIIPTLLIAVIFGVLIFQSGSKHGNDELKTINHKDERSSMLKVVYVFFTGLLLATFFGVGIATFYPAPTAPEYPSSLQYKDQTGKTMSEEDVARQKAFVDESKAYQDVFKVYARNVSISALALALMAALLGIILAERLKIIADGTLLGGFFTLLYSIGWGFATEDNRYRFFLVTIGLLVLLGFGYAKFVREGAKGSNRA